MSDEPIEWTHQSDGIEIDPLGFLVPRCTCGWSWAAVPDIETAIDVLMAHAAAAALESRPPGA